MTTMELLADALLLGRIFLFASATPLLFRLPIRKLHSLLARGERKAATNPARAQKIIRLTPLVLRLLRPFVKSHCLTRGLTLYFFLRRAGQDVSLAFGIAEAKEEFTGHCWLVKDGEPYLEKEDPRRMFSSVLLFAGPNLVTSDDLVREPSQK